MNTYTEEQLKFINNKGTESIILSATAGSGKTASTVGRLNRMIEDGVDPTRVIFFSFTNDAVNELRSRVKHDVKITTIHSFTSSILGKMGLFKPIVTFYDFTNWYKEKYKPNPKDPMKIKMEYARNVDRFYEEGSYISSTFSAYKLQNADNIRIPKPQFYDEYAAFIRDTKSRDFSDMLIDTEKYSRNPKYKQFFEGLYDYVFVDEYQDTSTLQMKILLAMKANQYHLIGDKFQCIIKGSEVLTETGYKKIEDLTLADKVVSGLGSNKIGLKSIKSISSHKYNGEFITLKTKSGRLITTTPSHTHFANFSFNNENKYIVYLMYKSGMGYRIGKTEIYPKRNVNNNSDRFGFKFRMNQGGGNKLWILNTFDNLDHALAYEDFISLKYSIPKTVFVARQNQKQESINMLFSMIDTDSNAKTLLSDFRYSIHQPHYVPKSNRKDITNMYLKLCEDGGQRNRTQGSIHTLQIHGSDKKIEQYFKDNGYKTTKDKDGWRIRKQSTNLSDLMNCVSMISDSVNLIQSVKLIGKSYQQLPASQVLVGMSLMVYEDGKIIEDEVIDRFYGDKEEAVYDIDIDNTHNIIVNGIFTHNSIYGFSGANCEEIENLLMKHKKVTQMTLTKNFRSKKCIVENSNKYSDLVAVPFHGDGGYIHDHLLTEIMMYEMMKDGKPLAILARTNNVIKEIEKESLKKKIPMRYFNYITPQDIDKIREGKINPSLKKKIDAVSPYYGNTFGLIKFIEDHKDSDVFVTSIHKSKGREFPRCIIINSIDPELLVESNYDTSDYTFVTDGGEIDMEARNIHYVAVTRPKEELYFLVYEN